MHHQTPKQYNNNKCVSNNKFSHTKRAFLKGIDIRPKQDLPLRCCNSLKSSDPGGDSEFLFNPSMGVGVRTLEMIKYLQIILWFRGEPRSCGFPHALPLTATHSAVSWKPPQPKRRHLWRTPTLVKVIINRPQQALWATSIQTAAARFVGFLDRQLKLRIVISGSALSDKFVSVLLTVLLYISSSAYQTNAYIYYPRCLFRSSRGVVLSLVLRVCQ